MLWRFSDVKKIWCCFFIIRDRLGLCHFKSG